MSKIIMFARNFPAYHPRKGEPTYFVEKILNSILIPHTGKEYMDHLCSLNFNALHSGKLVEQDILMFMASLYPFEKEEKHHTIRGSNRWAVGNKFSPRVWFGKPYRSKQIIFAPDVEIKKTWEFGMENDFFRSKIFWMKGISGELDSLFVAKNDGLKMKDFENWFDRRFTGQIICWNEKIKY